MESNRFPNFRSGDVVISTKLGEIEKRYQLHSSVLTRHSTWFQHVLKQIDPMDPHLSWYSFTLEETPWSIPKLVRQPTRGEHPVPFNTNQDVCIKTEDTGHDTFSMHSVSTNSDSGAINISPPISTTDIGTTLIQSELITQIAEELGSLHLIHPHLGSIFAQFRQELYVAIKGDPARGIKLSIPLENSSIYTEAMIHLVGAHPAWPWPTNRTSIPSALRQLIAHKSKELDVQCLEAEHDLMLNTITVGKRPTIIQLFRDWLCNVLTEQSETRSKQSLERGTLFRNLYKGGEAYLPFEEVKEVCGTIRGMSEWTDLSGDLKMVKQYGAAAAEDLARNEFMIEPKANGVGYLTCVKVELKDIWW
ncbi:hypothetical protein K469DRAFT_691770 [Zopfia rhizophila CBS 207.26]|uniref:BTB domain-containing protein n=1 Tax=Zopfia rhizophila CBS 207.26 TaxID=1314779 RepID=A0A6A6DTY4_9PEZI|nr:hypothetical protein K469DRAFT_691770 [Zopfia rhizophila CBS 207.26]